MTQIFLMIILIFATVNIHNILLWLNRGMEMPTPMVNDISSTPAHASIRRCIKSFTSCTFVLWIRCWIVNLWPRFCSQLDWGQGCSAATNLEVYRRDHDLWDYCTFGVEAANDAQTVWVNTACRKELSQKNLSKPILRFRNIYNQIASDVFFFSFMAYSAGALLCPSSKATFYQTSGKLIILFISSRQTSHNRC